MPRLPRWRKLRPDAPLDVIGTDGVLDLHAGDADVAIRYARTSPTDGTRQGFLSDSFWPVCSPELLTSGLKRLPTFVDTFSFIATGRHPISRRQPGRDGSRREASGAMCRNSRTWTT